MKEILTHIVHHHVRMGVRVGVRMRVVVRVHVVVVRQVVRREAGGRRAARELLRHLRQRGDGVEGRAAARVGVDGHVGAQAAAAERQRRAARPARQRALHDGNSNG